MSDFLVSPYLPDAADVLQPVLPSRCFLCGPDEQCRIVAHSSRGRKSGPQLSLVVVRCRSHRRFFTLYPPGFTPYSRLPLVHVDTSGRQLEPEEPAQDPWEGTRLELSADRPRRIVDTDDQAQAAAIRSNRRAGLRRLTTAAQLFGLLDGRVRLLEQLAVVLMLALSQLQQAAATWSSAAAARQRLIAVRALIAALPLEAGLLSRLLHAGHHTGLFGKAWFVRRHDGSPFPFRLPEQT